MDYLERTRYYRDALLSLTEWHAVEDDTRSKAYIEKAMAALSAATSRPIDEVLTADEK